MPIDNAYLDERIAKTKTLIAAVEDAIAELSAGSASYSLDTGQTRTSVTKADLGSLRLQLDSLDNRLSTLCARRTPASFYGRQGR